MISLTYCPGLYNVMGGGVLTLLGADARIGKMKPFRPRIPGLRGYPRLAAAAAQNAAAQFSASPITVYSLWWSEPSNPANTLQLVTPTRATKPAVRAASCTLAAAASARSAFSLKEQDCNPQAANRINPL